jgi:hypothetical protein
MPLSLKFLALSSCSPPEEKAKKMNASMEDMKDKICHLYAPEPGSYEHWICSMDASTIVGITIGVVAAFCVIAWIVWSCCCGPCRAVGKCVGNLLCMPFMCCVRRFTGLAGYDSDEEDDGSDDGRPSCCWRLLACCGCRRTEEGCSICGHAYEDGDDEDVRCCVMKCCACGGARRPVSFVV